MECKNNERPSDEELAKMTDAQVLAGDWIVDIEDSVFWKRWDEANANLTIEVNKAIAEGRASAYRLPIHGRPPIHATV